MLALRAKTDRGWALVYAFGFLEFLFFRYVNVNLALPVLNRAVMSVRGEASLAILGSGRMR
uniref:Uncharacterized protein n=1 Tax=Candidatus Kentrum sp. TC TaxID=2126339 RepID=A0A450ZSQ8_9GAMM|nr:MAG: hypothetical protein BECKTC1821F_GA0114240_101252 [Candidatus Kentron sp. TC]